MSFKSRLQRLLRRQSPPAEETVATPAAAPPPSPYEELKPEAETEPLETLSEDIPRIKDTFVFVENAEPARPSHPRSTVGLWYPGQRMIFIRNPGSGQPERLLRWQGHSRYVPFFGDWSGDGRERIGAYDPEESVFHLWSRDEAGEPDINFLYGPPKSGWRPLWGNWRGRGGDGIGVYDPSSCTFMLRQDLSGGEADLCFSYAPLGLGQIPLTGDWDGDGRDGVGAYDPASGRFCLRNALSPGEPDQSHVVPLAQPGWIPLVGDWEGIGRDSVGLYDPVSGTFFLCLLTQSENDEFFCFGSKGETAYPIAVRWRSDDAGPTPAA